MTETHRRRVRRWSLGAPVVVLLVAAGTAVVAVRHRPAAGAAEPAQATAATAKLERRDLSTTRALPGTIGYGAARPLAGHLGATVTWLPAVGATIKRGQQLYRADDRPVPLFYGAMPLYRPVAGTNLIGRDVRIVADNLRALGYSVGRQPAPGRFVAKTELKSGEGVLTPELIAAIKRWQAAAGLAVTGQVAVGDVEIQKGAVRVDSLAVQPGSPAAATLFSVTSTRKVVTVEAEAQDAATIQHGEQVTVGMPGDRTVKAHVAEVGRDLVKADGSSDPPKLAVTVSVDDPGTLAKLDSADVTVNFAGQTAKGVLAAPIEALVALTEGGYAVQGPGGLVSVRTGMFADGWVQISGAGLAPGVEVVVSS